MIHCSLVSDLEEDNMQKNVSRRLQLPSSV